MTLYRERRVLNHATDPKYRGTFVLLWAIIGSVHFLLQVEREDGP